MTDRAEQARKRAERAGLLKPKPRRTDMPSSNSILNRIAATAVTAMAVVAHRPTNDLSPEAVANAKPVLAEAVASAVASELRGDKIAVVETRSPLAMSTNWAQVVGFLAVIAGLFGLDIDPQTQRNIVAGIVGVMAVYTVVRRSRYTKTITPAAARKV